MRQSTDYITLNVLVLTSKTYTTGLQKTWTPGKTGRLNSDR